MGFLCRFLFRCRSSSSDRCVGIFGGILPGKINGWNLNIIPLKRENHLPGRIKKPLESMTILVPRVPLEVQNASVNVNESWITAGRFLAHPPSIQKTFPILQLGCWNPKRQKIFNFPRRCFLFRKKKNTFKGDSHKDRDFQHLPVEWSVSWRGWSWLHLTGSVGSGQIGQVSTAFCLWRPFFYRRCYQSIYERPKIYVKLRRKKQIGGGVLVFIHVFVLVWIEYIYIYIILELYLQT